MNFRTLYGVAFAVLLWLAPSVGHAQDGRWVSVESPNFIVYGESGERQARESVRQLEIFDAFLRQLTGTHAPPPENKLRIVLFRRSLGEVWPGVSESVRGFYSASVDSTAAYTLYHDLDGLDAREVLFHEYAHHFMLQYFADAYPSWFVEGFAEFVGPTDIQDDKLWVGGISSGRRDQLNNDNWMPFDRLLRSETRHGRDVFRFYAQSWLITNYILLSRERRIAFANYIRALREGADPVDAFQPAFGRTVEQLTSDLHSHFLHIARYELPLPPTPAYEVTVTHLPEAYDDLFPLSMRLRVYGFDEPPPPKDADEAREWQEELDDLVSDTMRQTERFPSDPLAQRERAEAQILHGQTDAARAILEPMIAADAANSQAHYLMGVSYLADARLHPENAAAAITQARRTFVHAYQIDPDDVATLYRYAESFPHPLQDQQLDVLLEAQRLAPQVDDISLAAAIALMEVNRHSEAVPLLRTVAYQPHGGRLSRRAKRVLEAALANQPPPPPSPDDDKDEDDD